MSNRISAFTGVLLFIAWLLGVMGLMHNEKIAKPKSKDVRGKGGANKAMAIFGDACAFGKCFVCHRKFPLSDLVVAHYIGDREKWDMPNGTDHVLICADCEIPEGWYGCGCGG